MAVRTDQSTCTEGPTRRDPGKESQEKDPGLEQRGEVTRLAVQPERNFWGEQSDLMEACEAVCCGVGVSPLGKHLESTLQIFPQNTETNRICSKNW